MASRAKKGDVPNNVLQLMHPDLPFDDSSVEEPKAKEAKAPDYATQMAELQASVKRLEDANNTLQRTNMALMGQPMQPQMPQFGPMEVNLEGLPDPVTNPKEYAQAIVQRGDAVLRARQERANWENKQNNEVLERVNGIWEQFTSLHPGFANKTDLVEAAANKAVAKARQSGLDTNKYMFAATPQFFQDTVAILNDWGVKEEDAEDTVEKDIPPLRTAGIPGGLDSGGKMSELQEETRIPTLMEEVRGWKMKTGFM